MGSETTCARPEEPQSGEEEVGFVVVFWGGGLGVVGAGGEVRGAGKVPSTGRTDRLSGSDGVCYKGRPGPVW